MKIKTVLIESGVAYANLEMEHPNKTSICDEYVNCSKGVGEKCECDILREKWHSGRLPFESFDDVDKRIWLAGNFENPQPLVDGLYPVDLDVEVVEQWKYKKGDGWHDLTYGEIRTTGNFEYRRVLRIT